MSYKPYQTIDETTGFLVDIKMEIEEELYELRQKLAKVNEIITRLQQVSHCEIKTPRAPRNFDKVSKRLKNLLERHDLMTTPFYELRDGIVSGAIPFARMRGVGTQALRELGEILSLEEIRKSRVSVVNVKTGRIRKI